MAQCNEVPSYEVTKFACTTYIYGHYSKVAHINGCLSPQPHAMFMFGQCMSLGMLIMSSGYA